MNLSRKAINDLIIKRDTIGLLQGYSEKDIGYILIDEKHSTHLPKSEILRPSAMEDDYLSDLAPFVDDLIIEFAKRRRLTDYAFERILQCRDLELAQKVWEYRQFDVDAYYSLPIMQWWHSLGRKFQKSDLDQILNHWNAQDCEERALWLLKTYPDYFDSQPIISHGFHNQEILSQILDLIPNKDIAQEILDSKALAFHLVKHLIEKWKIQPENIISILENAAYESYDSYIEASQYFSIDDKEHLLSIIKFLITDDNFIPFVDHIPKENLMMLLRSLDDKILITADHNNLRYMTSVLKDKEFAYNCAWLEYDYFCESTGRCLYETQRKAVIDILDFYKTYVPDFNINVSDDDTFNNFMLKNFG